MRSTTASAAGRPIWELSFYEAKRGLCLTQEILRSIQHPDRSSRLHSIYRRSRMRRFSVTSDLLDSAVGRWLVLQELFGLGKGNLPKRVRSAQGKPAAQKQGCPRNESEKNFSISAKAPSFKLETVVSKAWRISSRSVKGVRLTIILLRKVRNYLREQPTSWPDV